MSATGPHSISVIIPTRNSMPELHAHISALSEWISNVREVIVVDSESTDGTLECIRTRLKHESLKLMQNPVGLYKSWNAAIAEASSKYVYIATVGDVLPYESLKKLYEAAEQHEADVMVSAPQIVDERGRLQYNKWPVHDLIELLNIEDAYLLPVVERYIYNMTAMPATLIGSSASNLYLTSLLQSSPFPVDFGHCGDSAWALSRPCSDRWLVLPGIVSSFIKHAPADSRVKPPALSRRKLYRLAQEAFDALLADLGASRDESLALDCQRILDLYFEKAKVVEAFGELSKSAFPWQLRLRGWRLRSQKKRIKKEIMTRASDLRRLIMDRRVSLDTDGMEVR